MYVCVCVWVWVPPESEEIIGSLTRGFKPQSRCWELNLGPIQGQYAVLNTIPPLQHLLIKF